MHGQGAAIACGLIGVGDAEIETTTDGVQVVV
jgi:hypothetical protein